MAEPESNEVSIVKLCELLRDEEFDEDIVESFRTNKIDKITFLELDQDDLKQLGIVALGYKKRLMKLQQQVKVRKL